ncbi:T9SS type A sorting domain-containing protein [uncultured Kordia sp.]|uniref:T9SS type A sorting domain-containing protein n=1 Tax=uncultured Kordia sp. TaxID=507699 RepID=UPI002610FBC9|nr:T9SS type A sorting domain-containing protein [uncultured Kordia sp.]
MNLKLFTLTALFLFFVVKVSAQTADPVVPIPIDNIIDIDFSVTDGINGQHYAITTAAEHAVRSGDNFIFKINLNHNSQDSTVHYFGIQYTLERLFADGTREIIRGITAPVLIPPVKKKNGNFEVRIHDIRAEAYPFLIHGTHTLQNIRYEIKMNLVKYDSRADYINETNNYTRIEPAINFILDASNFPIPGDVVSLRTYPNPSIDHVIIEQTTIATENTIAQNSPLEVVIFNDKGIKMNQLSLAHNSKKANSTLYTVDVSHLQKGMYFFQFSQGNNTQVKTVIKK